ncbi:unnamed protein product, partial [marine sediment metagenome]
MAGEGPSASSSAVDALLSTLALDEDVCVSWKTRDELQRYLAQRAGVEITKPALNELLYELLAKG